MASRGWQASYSDLSVLTADLHVDHLLRLLAESALKLTSVCMAAYAASVLTLLGSAALLHQTPLGPTAVHASLRILTGSTDHANNSTDVATQASPTSSTCWPPLSWWPLSRRPLQTAQLMNLKKETWPLWRLVARWTTTEQICGKLSSCSAYCIVNGTGTRNGTVGSRGGPLISYFPFFQCCGSGFSEFRIQMRIRIQFQPIILFRQILKWLKQCFGSESVRFLYCRYNLFNLFLIFNRYRYCSYIRFFGKFVLILTLKIETGAGEPT